MRAQDLSRRLADLQPEFSERALALLVDCQERGATMVPYCTVRTAEEQARLWRQSRTTAEIEAAIKQMEKAGAPYLAGVLRDVGPQYGTHVTNALPGLSWHQWGLAFDAYWLVDGRAEWSTRKRVEHERRKVNGYVLMTELAERHGLTAGGSWSRFKDYPHVQGPDTGVLAAYSWPEIDSALTP